MKPAKAAKMLKGILALVLSVVMFMGNIMTVYATEGNAPSTGNTGNIGTLDGAGQSLGTGDATETGNIADKEIPKNTETAGSTEDTGANKTGNSGNIEEIESGGNTGIAGGAEGGSAQDAGNTGNKDNTGDKDNTGNTGDTEGIGETPAEESGDTGKTETGADTECDSSTEAENTGETVGAETGNTADASGTEVGNNAGKEEAAGAEDDGKAKIPGTRKEFVYQDEQVNVTVTLQNPADLPAGAELKVKPVVVTECLEDSVEQASGAVQTVNHVSAYDISFILDGKEVEPKATVQVQITIPEVTVGDTAEVYHYNENSGYAEDMGAQVTTAGEVEFQTTHFSIYVVVNVTKKELKARMEHYLVTDGKITEISRAQEGIIQAEEKIKFQTLDTENDCYELTKVELIPAGSEPTVYEKAKGDDLNAVLKQYEATEDVLIKCYYAGTSGTYTNEVTFFDYDLGGETTYTETGYESLENGRWYVFSYEGKKYDNVQAKWDADSGKLSLVQQVWWPIPEWKELLVFEKGQTYQFHGNGGIEDWTYLGKNEFSHEVSVSVKNKGINSAENYPEDATENRLTVGQVKLYECNVPQNGRMWDANISHGAEQPIIQGLVKNLSGENYQDVNFADGVYTAGLFSTDEVTGKRIIDGYYMNFSREGNVYTLQNVTKGNGKGAEIVVDDLYNYWPLDSEPGEDALYNESDDKKPHNWYFATRYDFEFTLGDYIGELEYEFNGDDDLWVFLDGEPVLDMGGIHSGYPYNNVNAGYSEWLSKYPNKVDLWKHIEGGKDNCDREKTHRITVLLMERGGYGSNCKMKFVLPNVVASDPVITTAPKTTLVFDKVDMVTDEAVSGAGFTLYREDQTTVVAKAVSASDGKVTFSGLKEGNYYLKETAAPEGYEESNVWYKVVVTLQDEKAEAKLYQTDGTTEIDKIGNMPDISKIENVINDKTVRLIDWDARTYRIDLYAAHNVEGDYDITSVTVKDYIDERFVLTDENGELLMTGDIWNGGLIDADEKGLYIQWTDQTLFYTSNIKDALWHQTLYVRAKDNYIGGNDVHTNGEKSGVILENGDTKPFVRPLVNVKVRFDADMAEDTIFRGEDIDDLNYNIGMMNQRIVDKSAVSYIDENGRKQIFDCVDGNKFCFEWYLKVEAGDDVSGKVDLGDGRYGVKVTVEELFAQKERAAYYVKVMYNELAASGESLSNTGNMQVTKENAYAIGQYDLFVTDGQITIRKQIEKQDYKETDGDPIFTFRITGEKTGKVYYKTLRFSNVSGVGTEIRETVITGLSKDNYTVEELETMGFVLRDVLTDGSECEAKVTEDKKAVFAIGTNYKIENRQATYGHKGLAAFRNEKQREPGKMTDTDVVKNSFILGEEANNGKHTTPDADNGTVWDAITTVTGRLEKEE